MDDPDSLLEASPGMAQLLVASIVDYAIYLLGLDGTIKSWNAGAQRLKGYSAKDVVGSHFGVFYTDDDVRAGQPARALAIALAQGKYEAQGWRLRKDGTRFWASVVIDAARNPAGEVVGFAKITRDITQLRVEREQLLAAKKSADEAAARASISAEHHRIATAKLADKNRLMAMAERMAHVGHWRFDIASGELYWSPEVCRTLGFPVAHKPTLDEALSTYHPADRGRVTNIIEKAISQGTPIAFEARIVRPDGTMREVLCRGQAESVSDGTIAAIFGVYQDVTAAKEAERERQRLSERARVQRSNDLTAINELMAMAQEMTGVGYWHVDLRTKDRRCSDEVYRIFGVAPGDPVPVEAVSNVYAAEDRERIARIVESTKASGSAYNFETRLTRSDGNVRDVVVTGRVERADDGTPLVLKGAIQDVTERKNLTRDRDRLIMRVGLATRAAQVGIWDWDIVTNAIVWDPIMFALYGFDDGAFSAVYERWTAALHPDDRARAERDIAQAAVTGRSFESEFRIVWPTGEVRHIQANATVVCDAAGAPQRMIGTNWDVTEVRTLNARLQHEQERLLAERATLLARTVELHELSTLQRAILSGAPVGIVATDIDGTITLFNPAAERMLRYSAQEIVGRMTPAHFHDQAEVAALAATLTAELGRRVEPGFEAFIARAREGATDTHEWTYIRKDGGRFPVLLSVTALRTERGDVFGYLGMATDQTERHRGDDAVRESTRFLQGVTDNIPAMVGYWDHDLRCRFANAAYYGWFGKTRDEALGMRMRDFLSPPVFAQNQHHITGALGGEKQTFERRLERPDGSATYTWAHYIPDIVDGVVRGFYTLLTDVTAIKESEIRLEGLNEVLRARTIEAEAATASKSQFLANMSHEIRSPMNAILGMLQLLQTTGLSARQADYAAKACVATGALLRLLNDILDFSKIEAGKLTFEQAPFEIDAMMGDVSTLLSSSLGDKPVELLFVNDQHLPKRLRGDAFRLRQVLLNLAGNAIKFTAQGEIIIEIRQVAQRPASCDIEFSVTDTGIGIAPEQRAAIFEGFNQGESSTTRRYGGSGLGLAISQHIVSLMGGQLDVESKTGTGSRFHFTLTFERAADPAALDSPRQAKRPPTRREHVLIVDDNEHARTALMNIVASFGWTSDGAGSGREALELIARAGAGRVYGRIFIDWMMPELDGWQTAGRVRERLTAHDVTIVVMASAHDLLKLSPRLESEPDVVDALLVKPITASSLLNSLLEPRAHRVDVPLAPPNAQRRLRALKILVVDDFAINLEIAGALLSLEGAEVELADCSEAAIDKVLRSKPPFDVVLMDVQMPQTDGYETTRRLRELPGIDGLIIVAMTANAMETDKAACLAAGMDDHIPKPIDINVVVDTILAHCRPSRAVRINAMLPIEVDAALQRLGDNRELFATLAGRFIEKSDALIAELRASLHAGAIPDATRLLHQLKGFAGTVGNTVLGALAARLETQLKETGCLSKQDLARLAALTVAGNAALTEVLTNLGVAAPAPGSAPELDRATIRTRLAEIDDLLAAANMRAVSACSELVRKLDAASAQRLAPLVQAIDRLDFPQARTELTRLLPQFDRPPENRGHR